MLSQSVVKVLDELVLSVHCLADIKYILDYLITRRLGDNTDNYLSFSAVNDVMEWMIKII